MCGEGGAFGEGLQAPIQKSVLPGSSVPPTRSSRQPIMSTEAPLLETTIGCAGQAIDEPRSTKSTPSKTPTAVISSTPFDVKQAVRSWLKQRVIEPP